MTQAILLAGAGVAGFCAAWVALRFTGTHACSQIEEAGGGWWWRHRRIRMQCLVVEAAEARIAGRYRRALNLARRAHRLAGDPRAMVEAGLAHRELGNLESAQAWLEKACNRMAHGLCETGFHAMDLEMQAKYALALVHAALSRHGEAPDREMHLESCLHLLQEAFEADDDFIEASDHEIALVHIQDLVQGLIDRTLSECSEEWMQR